ncbi:hypothetical protein SO802_021487 [Lithocarpus litseifolius]|uniref:AT3G52170-like helix-turn-helix domain-containing protein n=1 Tax=Lithocarpus litseifolius TaxID=425828 RepID=A0AAW2CFA5_9ROSI
MGKNLIARIAAAAAAATQSLKFNNQSHNKVKNIDQWRRNSNSNAASVPDTDRVVRTRLSKLERQAMVESFVNKYREMNAGKFPTASSAVKQVGGSYYTVRKIIQELQYKSKLSSSDTRKGTPFLKPTISFPSQQVLVKPAMPGSHSDIDAKLSDVLKGDAEVSPCLEKPEDDKEEEAQQNHLLKEETEDVSLSCLEPSENVNAEEVSPLCFEKPADDKKEDAQHNDFDSVPSENRLRREETEDVSYSCLEISRDIENDRAQGDHSGFAATENHPLVGEIEEVLRPCLEKAEDDKQEQAVDHNLPNVDGLGSKAVQDQGSIELDKNVKDVSTRQKNDAEVPKKSSLWGNLKSLADGIINIWRKM